MKLNWVREKEELGRRIVTLLYDLGAIRTWYRDKPYGWTLVSGLWSPFYIQLRPTCSYRHADRLLKEIGYAIGRIIQEETKGVNRLLGIAFAGIPIAVATTIMSGIPSCYTRKIDGTQLQFAEKGIMEYGEHALVEGELADGDRIAIVDDVVTKFDSKLLAIDLLKAEFKRRGLPGRINCDDVVVLIDREQGAQERAATLGLKLHSLIPFKTKGIDWLRDRLSIDEYGVIKNYLESPGLFQDREIQAELEKKTRNGSTKQKPGQGEAKLLLE